MSEMASYSQYLNIHNLNIHRASVHQQEAVRRVRYSLAGEVVTQKFWASKLTKEPKNKQPVSYEL